MSQLRLDARKPRSARLVPPPSKSDALRLLALAHILDRPAWLTAIGPKPWASDIETFASALEMLRSAGRQSEAVLIDCQDGGAPLRFLLSMAAITPGRFRFVGSARLGARPHAPLVTALSRSLGASGLSIRSGEPWPIEVHSTGATDEPAFRVSGAESSQFASSLTLAAAALVHREHRAWLVEIEGQVVSEGYLELTLRALRQAGFRVDRSRSSVEILAWDALASAELAPAVPADWSAMGFLLPIAWKTGSSVTGLALGDDDIHPDRAIVEHLHHAGLEVSQHSGETRVTGQLRRGVRASVARSPDLIPVLAALACLLPDTSVFTETSRLRSKESDRLAAIQDLVATGGATSHLEGDSLHIEPAGHGTPARAPELLRFDARDDHRMIMAAATLAVLLGTTLELRGATGVEKSFPGFFGQLALAGIELC